MMIFNAVSEVLGKMAVSISLGLLLTFNSLLSYAVQVGDAYEGGTVFCVSQTPDISQCVLFGSGDYGLIMANEDQANFDSNPQHGVTWSSDRWKVGAFSKNNGAINTDIIINSCPFDSPQNNAAWLCHNYRDPEGHTDWYLPAKHELHKMYFYARIHHLIGRGCQGERPGTVRCLIGGWNDQDKVYWSSTEDSHSFLRAHGFQKFGDGSQGMSHKINGYFGVRAIRTFRKKKTDESVNCSSHPKTAQPAARTTRSDEEVGTRDPVYLQAWLQWKLPSITTLRELTSVSEWINRRGGYIDDFVLIALWLTAQPNTDATNLLQIIHNSQATSETLLAVVNHRAVNEEILRSVINHPKINSNILSVIAAHPLLDGHAMLAIAYHPFADSRSLRLLLQHANVDLHLLLALAERWDNNEELLLNLVKHPLANAFLLEKIACRSNVNTTILTTIAQHPQVTSRLLVILLEHTALDTELLLAIASNRQTDRANLMRIIRHPAINPLVLAAVAKHPNTDQVLLGMITQHPCAEEDVLQAVQHNPNVNATVLTAVVESRQRQLDLARLRASKF